MWGQFTSGKVWFWIFITKTHSLMHRNSGVSVAFYYHNLVLADGALMSLCCARTLKTLNSTFDFGEV